VYFRCGRCRARRISGIAEVGFVGDGGEREDQGRAIAMRSQAGRGADAWNRGGGGAVRERGGGGGGVGARTGGARFRGRKGTWRQNHAPPIVWTPTLCS
jgi:hypothetical protein